MRPEHQLVHDFFDAVTAGELADDLLTEDMTGWITAGGTMDKASYQGLIRILARMCSEPIRFTIDSIPAVEDRAVVEVCSTATLVNGESYAMTYVYVFRIREGRIATVAEHYNALISKEKWMPLMKGLQQS
jgi:ketosteroid isomerase-like protein